MANVSTDSVKGVAGEIIAIVDSLKATVDETKGQLAEVRTQASKLSSYNGQEVHGSRTVEAIDLTNKVEVIRVWDISGADGVISNAATCLKQLSTIEEATAVLKGEAFNAESIAEAIEGYIVSVQSELGDNVDSTALLAAFGALAAPGVAKSNISFDGAGANNRDFIDYDKIKSEYWTDKKLNFEKQEDGSYAIYQDDDSGNKTLMGYTTGLTAALYMSTLSKVSNATPVYSKDEMLIKKAEKEADKTYSKDEWLIRKAEEEKDKNDVNIKLEPYNPDATTKTDVNIKLEPYNPYATTKTDNLISTIDAVNDTKIEANTPTSILDAVNDTKVESSKPTSILDEIQ